MIGDGRPLPFCERKEDVKKYLYPALAVLAGVFVLCLVSSSDSASVKKEGKFVKTDSGLQYKDTEEGKGEAAKKGDVVEVNYTGWLTTDGTNKGKKFDSSIGRAPFRFKLGAGEVIKGWDEGVAGMKPGGKRTPRHSAGAGLWGARRRRGHPAELHAALRRGIVAHQVISFARSPVWLARRASEG